MAQESFVSHKRNIELKGREKYERKGQDSGKPEKRYLKNVERKGKVSEVRGCSRTEKRSIYLLSLALPSMQGLKCTDSRTLGSNDSKACCQQFFVAAVFLLQLRDSLQDNVYGPLYSLNSSECETYGNEYSWVFSLHYIFLCSSFKNPLLIRTGI